MGKLSHTLSCNTSRNIVYANLIMNEGDYDIANNRSPIDYSITLTTGSVGWATSWGDWGQRIYVKAYIDGQSIGPIYIPNYNYNGAGGPGSSFASGRIWITHNNDGSKSISASIEFVDNADGYNGKIYYTPGDGSNSVNGLSLQTIPRASTPSMGEATIGSSITINTNRASSSFTHTLTYSFGSASGTIGTGVGGSINWTPPNDLARQLPNNTVGSGTITCTTYNGGNNIGTKSINFTAYVPDSMIPSVDSINIRDGNSTVTSKNIGYFVEGKSYGILDAGYSGSYGSSISSISLTIAGSTISSSSLSGLNTKLSSIKLPVGDNNSISVRVTDSRGRTSGSRTDTYTVKAYRPPSLTNTNAIRSNSSGDSDDNGTAIRAELRASVSSLGGKNKLTVKIGYHLVSGGSYNWSTFIDASSSTLSVDYTGGSRKVLWNGSISTGSSYYCQIYISDLFESNTRTYTISTGFDLMHFNASGKALAIGKKSEAGNGSLFEVGMESRFSSKADFKGGLYINGSKYDSSIFAKTGSNNNLISYGNEFNFIPDSAPAGVYINYRKLNGSTSGDPAVSFYRFCNGQGSALADIYARKIYADNFYPVGAVYISTSSISPAEIFGGSWAKITGRFLLGCDPPAANTTNYHGELNYNGDDYWSSSGHLGGSFRHNHKYGVNFAEYYGSAIITDQQGSHETGVWDGVNQSYVHMESSGQCYTYYNNGLRTTTSATDYMVTKAATARTSNQDGMPPYYTVHMWRRTG